MNQNKGYILLLIAIGGVLIFVNPVLAESCPSITTVTGTTVNFVGEITDMGGDSTVTAWFEYGQGPNYGQTSPQKTLNQLEIYCLTVSNLSPCTTYHYRAVARNSAGTSYGENKNFTTTCGPITTVDIKANGSDGPITISSNSSVSLTWTSSNANSCVASGNWSGSKSLSGSESIGNLLSSKTYTITCSGSGGSASDSVTINIESKTPAKISLRKTIKNVSQGTVFSDTVPANPGDTLVVGIVVKAKNKPLSDVIVKETLPTGLIYKGDLKVNEVLTIGDILTGLNIGSLAIDQEKTITFQAEVAGPENFSFGQTELTNTVLVSNKEISRSDAAKVIVSKAAVAGVATAISTGLTNNVLFDFLLIPLVVALLITWFFRPHLLIFEEWLDKRKKHFQEYKSKKLLQLKIAQIRIKELLKSQ